MVFRVTDSSSGLVTQINTQRQRIANAQTQVATGKRLNHPAEDPYGAAAVIRLRTSQAVLEQFKTNAQSADTSLSVSDGALDSYQNKLNRARALVSQGISGFLKDTGRQAIASEIDGLREQFLNLANLRSEDLYIFGGTRQNEPPFDPTTATLSTNPTTRRLIQIQPDAAPVTSGVTAEEVFTNANGTLFDTLTATATALRGTGDPVADQAALNTALQQLDVFAEQANVARTTIGKTLNAVELATDRGSQTSLSLEAAAQDIEAVDFAKAAQQLVEAERALEAILQSSARTGRRSLIDLLG